MKCKQCGKDDLPLNQQSSLCVRCFLDNEASQEKAILEAAEKNGDNLMALLQEAIETMDEKRANRLLDKVHQIQSEGLRDARGWKTDD